MSWQTDIYRDAAIAYRLVLAHLTHDTDAILDVIVPEVDPHRWRGITIGLAGECAAVLEATKGRQDAIKDTERRIASLLDDSESDT